MSDLNFTAGIDTKEFKAAIQSMRNDIAGLNNTVKSETSSIDSSFKNLAGGIAGYFSAQALVGFTRQLINVRGEFQKTEIAFTTMLGSAEKSKALMAQMVDLAAKTPFGLQDVTDGAKRLLAFQIPAEQVVGTLTRLGNVAAGLGVPMGQLIHVYGQVKAQGKLMTNDLYQFMNAGIPMTAELAKVMGVTESKVKDLISAGKVGFPEVQKVIANLTDEGGMFFNLMEAQSYSLSGKWANLQDNLDQMLNKIGESNQGLLSDGIDGLNYLVENYESLISIIEQLVFAFGAYKAALIATYAWQVLSERATLQQALAHGTLTTVQKYNAAATVLLQGSWKSLNATMALSPIGIVAGLLAGLTYVIYKNVTATTAMEQIQEQLNQKTKELSKNVDSQKSKIASLIGIIKNKNSTDEQQRKALEGIKSLSNGRLKDLTLEAVKTGKAASAIKDYIGMLYLEADAKKEIAKKQLLEDKRNEILKDSYNNLSWDERIGNFDGAGDVLKGMTAQDRKRRAMIRDLIAVNKGIKEADNNLKKLQEKGVNVVGSITGDAYSAAENTAEKTDSTGKNINKSVDKIYGENTLKGLQQRVDKYREIMEKSSIGSDAFNSAKSSMEAYQKKLDELTKETQKKSFEEQLSETKRQIEVRDKLLQAGYSQETVNAMFPEIKDKSFEQYLNDTIDSLKKLIETGKGTEQTAQDLSLFTDELEKWKGYDSYIDKLSKSIEELKSKYSGIELVGKLDELGNTSGNETENEAQAKKIAVQKAKEVALEEWKKYYQELLNEQKTYEEKSAELQEQWQKVKNYDEYKNGSDADRSKIDKSFSKKATDLFFEQMQNSEEWAKAFTDVNMVATQKLEELKTILQTKLSEAKTIEEKIKIGEFIKKIDDTLAQRNPFANLSNAIGKYTESLKNAKSAQDKYNDAVAEFGQDSDEAKSALERLKTAQDGVNTSKLEMANSLSNFASKGISYISDIKGIITDVQGAFDDLGLSLDNGFGDVLDKMSGVMDGMQQQLEGVMQIAQGILTGNPIAVVGGVIKSIAGQIKTYAALFNNDRKRERNIKKWAAAVNELKNKYTELAYAVEKALGTAKYDNQNSMIKNLKEQQATLQKMYNEESKKKKKDQGKLDDYKNQIADINRQIQDITDDMVSNILQTDVKSLADSLGDALLAAWQKGASGADAYKEVAKKAMQDAVLNALKMSILEPQMEAFTKQLLASMGYSQNADGTVTGSFDGLTSDEQQNLQDMMGQIYSQFEQAMSGYTDLFGVGETANDSLEGAVKGVTEETASVIAGQMNAIRVNQGELLKIQQINQEIFKSQLLALTQIEANTRYNRDIYRVINSLFDQLRAKGIV